MLLSPSSTSRSRFTTWYSVRKILVKPRLGKRRCNGICPPSKPRIMREPERDRWPLWPRAEVLPMPLPMPRPTRFLFDVAPLGGRNVERLVGTLFFLCHSRLLIAFQPVYSVSLIFNRVIGSSGDRFQISRSPDLPIFNYSTTCTRWGILAIMPRIDGVSSRSTIWFKRVKPSPLTTSLCFTGVQILERTY